MNNKRRLSLGAVTALLITAGIDRVEAREMPVKGTFAGTFLSTSINVFHPPSGPDDPAYWNTSEVTGNLGKRTSQAITEEVPGDPDPDCFGGSGSVGIVNAAEGKGFGTATQTFPNGDQIYSQILTRKACVDLLSGKFTGVDTGVIVGGTGKFTGASGSFTQSFSGFFQFPGFGSFTGEFSGMMQLP